MSLESREIEIACKLIRLDAKRRASLSSYGDAIRFAFKWANPGDSPDMILTGVAARLATLWDKNLGVLEEPIDDVRSMDYIRALESLAWAEPNTMKKSVSALNTVDAVEFFELLATQRAVSVELAQRTVMSGLARFIINRVVAAAAALDAQVEVDLPYRLKPNPESSWHPAPHGGIGDSGAWVFGIAQLHACLAGWDAVWALPPRPTPSADALPRAAYFAPLAVLMFACLSWINPALAIARWINLGMPDDDPVLRLIKRQWGKWAMAHALAHDTSAYWTSGEAHGLAHGLSTQQTHPATVGRRGRDFLASSSYGTGQLKFADELHMQAHIPMQLGLNGDGLPARTLFTDGSEAILKLDGYGGWTGALRRAGEELIRRHPNHDWTIGVLSKDVGYLGDFRYSPVTDCWHVGTTETHLLGWVR